MTGTTQRPPGVGLLFRPQSAIDAAPAGERDAYYRIVEGICADPGACGFDFGTPADLEADAVVDARLAALNDDWT
jgi:hypothetical protein